MSRAEMYGRLYSCGFEIIDEKLFCDNIKGLLSKKPNVIGACCGSTPQHIKLINQISVC